MNLIIVLIFVVSFNNFFRKVYLNTLLWGLDFFELPFYVTFVEQLFPLSYSLDRI